MRASSGRTAALKPLAAIAACACLLAACATSPTSYQAAALQASDAGDQKTAISLSRKEVAQFSTADQCSPTTTLNCGTLALAYGALAGYQILDGDRMGGERSFIGAKGALMRTAPANRASATAMVYRDVSEAYWKTGDRARAVAVFNEGRVAGGDSYLYMSSAARADAQQQQTEPTRPADAPTDVAPVNRSAGLAPGQPRP
jgi:hypothetical protein